MRRGSARLGPVRVTWGATTLDAAGNLSFLADGDAPASARFDVEVADPEPLDVHDAFFGDVRVAVAPGRVRVSGPGASFRVTEREVVGRVRSHPTLAASLAVHALAAFHGLAHVHAAVFRIAGRVVIAPGGSGSGKTSLALAIARHGGELLTDDITYVDPDGTAWPVRRSPHVLDDTLRRHPELEVLGPVEDGMLSKMRVASPSLGPASPSRVDAVVMPCIDPIDTTRIEPIDPARAFALLVGSSALAMIDGSPRRDTQLDTLARLAELPLACLVAGRDALADDRVLVDALRSHFRS